MKLKQHLILIFACSSLILVGQESNAYKSKWQIKPLAGANIPLTKLFQGTESDYLFQYDDHSYYWQLLSVSYFFSKHWGLEFNYQAGTSSRIRQRADKLTNLIQQEYRENYYVSPRVGALEEDLNYFGGDIQRGFLGAIYRFETDKFYAYPKFAIGLTSFYTDWGGADLKEKNSNLEYRINYSSGKPIPVRDYFTIAPSVSIGYKLSNRFFLNADFMFSYFKTDITYKKEITNLYTNESVVDYFDYKRNISTLSLGAGLIIVLF